MLEELNAALESFKRDLQRGDEAALLDAAFAVHQLISAACAAGHEVQAVKSNGRVLKMGSVGPLTRTHFPYDRRPPDLVQGWSEPHDECELVTIVSFQLAKGF